MLEQLMADIVPCSLLQLNCGRFFLMADFFHSNIKYREGVQR